MPLVLQLTDAGLDAVVAAESGGTDAIHIAEIGITETPFDQAPTLVAIPNETKRISTLAGEPVAANIIHLTAQDTSADVYAMTGFGLYLADGTLFATYSNAAPVLSKATLAFALISVDIAFAADISAQLAFGDNVFLYPPATETVKGVAKLATQARVSDPADGADDAETIVTPKTLRQRLADLWTDITNLVNGEATTRGDADTALQNNLDAEATTRSDADTAIQAALDAFKALFSTGSNANGRWWKMPDGAGGTAIEQQGSHGAISGQVTVNIVFPTAFTATDYDLQFTPVIPSAGDYDNAIQEVSGTRTVNGVTVYSQDPSSGGSSDLAGFNWRAKGY